MTPKEKAEQLYTWYNNLIIDEVIDKKVIYLIMTDKMAKKSALIAVEEILQHCYEVMKPFWQEIKQEIINL